MITITKICAINITETKLAIKSRMATLHIVLAILVTIPTLLLFLVSVLYFHYGIDGWDDMVREFNILKFKFSFGWSHATIQRRKVNYIKTWKASVEKFGDLVFLEKGRSTYTYNEVNCNFYRILI